ncbi:hypothetical protein HWV62_17374 [Athelia sp. TMB]|nr:hypothetical protein HWV62_17374 [Athelia sp. TMB]
MDHMAYKFSNNSNFHTRGGRDHQRERDSEIPPPIEQQQVYIAPTAPQQDTSMEPVTKASISRAAITPATPRARTEMYMGHLMLTVNTRELRSRLSLAATAPGRDRAGMVGETQCKEFPAEVES